MSDPLGSNFLNNSIANFAMEEHVLLEHVVEADDDDYDYDEESSSNDSSSDDDEMDQDEESSSYDGSSYDDEMDQDEFCGSYGSSSSLGKSPLPSMSPPPRNMQEIDHNASLKNLKTNKCYLLTTVKMAKIQTRDKKMMRCFQRPIALFPLPL